MSVTVIIGPMFSGKTHELIRRLNREIIAGNKYILFKYTKDVRYGRNALATSHDGHTLPAVPISSLVDRQIDDDIKVIGIDEGQFIEGLCEFCDQQANLGRKVIVSALDSNFKREPFDRIINLIPKAEHVQKLHSVCINCKILPGSFSKKIVPNNLIEEIGGADKYISVCRQCYHLDTSMDVIEHYRGLLNKNV